MYRGSRKKINLWYFVLGGVVVIGLLLSVWYYQNTYRYFGPVAPFIMLTQEEQQLRCHEKTRLMEADLRKWNNLQDARFLDGKIDFERAFHLEEQRERKLAEIEKNRNRCWDL